LWKGLQGYAKIRLIRSLKKFIFRYQDLVEIYSVSADLKVFLTFTFVVKILQVTRGCWWRWFTIDVPPSSLNLVLLWQLFYLFCSSVVINAMYCYSDIRNLLSRNESGRFGALKADSAHHFFRNACTKSGSLRFSQYSGCWLILSVYILMSFDFPFGRLFGVR
jgi:hypothetical protein